MTRTLSELRSQRWFAADTIRAFAHRQRAQQMGMRRADFMGKPVIAIINTWSDLSPCHAHLRDRAEAVKRGVWQAGGYPAELPALSVGEVMVKPTTMLYRNFLAMETEELLRSHPVDGAVLLGGCDKSTPGLLMGAILNLRPDLYRGVINEVPFVDVVTTMLDESIPLTTNEFEEWGNPKDKAAYNYMLSYSPYDNIKAQAYPSIYVRTGLWDSQVQYYEPTKWVARLRATKTDDNLLVLDIDMAAGHGGKSGRFDKLKDIARTAAFMLMIHDRPDTRAHWPN